MIFKTEHDRVRRFLLGTLPEEDRIALERQFFRDDERYEEVRALEDELMYAYLQGELSAEDRTRFEARVLSTPAGRDRARFARALIRSVNKAEVPAAPKPAFAAPATAGRWHVGGLFHPAGWALAAATLVLAVWSGWLILQTRSLRSEMARLQSEADGSRTSRDRLARELERERRERAQLQERMAQAQRPPGRDIQAAASPSRTVVPLLLAMGLVRGGGEAPRVALPPTADRLRLQLDLGDAGGYASYRVAILTAEGEQVWSQDRLSAGRAGRSLAVVIEVPAKLLPRGDYEVTLLGLTAAHEPERIGSYYFSIVRR